MQSFAQLESFEKIAKQRRAKPEHLGKRKKISHKDILGKVEEYMRKQDLKGGVVYGNTNEVQRTLQQYGDRTIIAMKVVRTPLASALNRLLNWVTLGKMKKLKNKHGYNDFFHLALELNLGGGRKIYLEKNERVNLSPRFSTNKKTQTMEVNINGKPQKTVRELFETTLKKIGQYNFYQYRAFSLNCQKFIQDVLRANGFLTPKLNDFIMQDVESIAKNLSGTTKKVANFLTDAAGKFSKWFGRGKTKLQKNPKALKEKKDRVLDIMRPGQEKETLYKGLPTQVREKVRSMLSDDDPSPKHIVKDYSNMYLTKDMPKKVREQFEGYLQPDDQALDNFARRMSLPTRDRSFREKYNDLPYFRDDLRMTWRDSTGKQQWHPWSVGDVARDMHKSYKESEKGRKLRKELEDYESRRKVAQKSFMKERENTTTSDRVRIPIKDYEVQDTILPALTTPGVISTPKIKKKVERTVFAPPGRVRSMVEQMGEGGGQWCDARCLHSNIEVTLRATQLYSSL